MAITELLNLELDVLPFLNMSATPVDGGTKLQGFVEAITSVVEFVVGHVVPQSFTETHDGGDISIFLRQTPLLSIQEMTEVIGIVPWNLTEQPVGQAVDNFGYTIEDTFSGHIMRRSAGSQPFQFYANNGNISVTYTAGRSSVPPNIRLGALKLIQLHWGTQQGRPPAGVQAAEIEPSNQGQTILGFFVPRRILEILGANEKPVVIA